VGVGTGGLMRGGLDTLLGPEETDLRPPDGIFFGRVRPGAGLSVALRSAPVTGFVVVVGVFGRDRLCIKRHLRAPVFWGLVGWLWCGWGGAVCFLRTAQWTRASLYRF
jgi:hypothetical protein